MIINKNFGKLQLESHWEETLWQRVTKSDHNEKFRQGTIKKKRKLHVQIHQIKLFACNIEQLINVAS